MNVSWRTLLFLVTCTNIIVLLTGIIFARIFDVRSNVYEKSEEVNVDRRLTLLLMGKTGGGKSATGNSILGRKAFTTSPDSMSFIEDVKSAYVDFGRYTLKIVDSLGLEDTDLNQTTDKKIGPKNMDETIMMCSEGVDVFLYVMPFGSRFTQKEKFSFYALKRIFGEAFLDHVIVVISKGDQFQKSMEEEDRNITFQDWCKQQEGDFQRLYQACNGRFVLFNNREEDKEKKLAQVQKLIHLTESVHFQHCRYNSKCFEEATAKREKMILERKLPQLKEEIQEKIGLLVAEIDTFSERSSNNGRNKVEKRIQDLEDEIERQDESYGVLKDLLEKVKKLREYLEDKVKLKQASEELEDERNQFYK